MGVFGFDSGSLFRRRSKESSSSSSQKPKSLSEVQDELVKKYPPGAVVILTRTPSRSADCFRWDYHRPKYRYPTCEEWIEKFYEYQRSCGRNCPVWSKIQIETCGLEVYPEKLLNDSN
ncbi:uncharacterized protein LOC133717872 [Rosa rugosa]|uniref:uncharacterized protein LOC133717872 n=1 Tax=Rosa rugosa TaxID=74645 RepID=UPI002B407B90|nr:uncharacterized protein LOC133717872 [Rosa rugosa]